MPIMIPVFDPTPAAPPAAAGHLWLPDHRFGSPHLLYPLRKPRGPRLTIDWSNPITRGLRGCYLFNESDDGIWGRAEDIVPNSLFGPLAMYSGAEFSPRGFIARGDNECARTVTNLNSSQVDVLNKAYTINWVGNRINPTVSYCYWWYYKNYETLSMRQGPATGELYVNAEPAPGGSIGDDYINGNSSPTFALTFSREEEYGLSHLLIENKYRADTAARFEQTVHDTNRLCVGGRDDSTARSSQCETEAFFFWDRHLTQAELWSIHKHPYQFIIPANQVWRLGGTGEEPEPQIGAQLYVPQKRIVSPSYAVPKRQAVSTPTIDWQNPLSRGLIRCYMQLGRMENTSIDLVTGKLRLPAKYSIPTVGFDPELGFIVDMVNTSNAWRLPSVGKELPSGSVYNLSRSNLVASSDLLFGHIDYANNHRIYLGWNTLTSIYLRLGSTAAVGRTIPGATRTIGNIESIGASWNVGTAYAYWNGEQAGASYSYSGTPGSALDKTMYGYTDASGLTCDHDIALTYVFDRALSHGEQMQLHLDPYQLVVPAISRIMITGETAAAESPTFGQDPLSILLANVNKILGVPKENISKFIGVN